MNGSSISHFRNQPQNQFLYLQDNSSPIFKAIAGVSSPGAVDENCSISLPVFSLNLFTLRPTYFDSHGALHLENNQGVLVS